MPGPMSEDAFETMCTVDRSRSAWNTCSRIVVASSSGHGLDPRSVSQHFETEGGPSCGARLLIEHKCTD